MGDRGCGRRQTGFTLLEVVVAVAVLGALVATTYPILTGVRADALAAGERARVRGWLTVLPIEATADTALALDGYRLRWTRVGGGGEADGYQWWRVDAEPAEGGGVACSLLRCAPPPTPPAGEEP